MYLSCDVTGLTDDVKVERYWTKDGVAIKQVDTKRRMHYFPDAKTLQITQTGRDTKRRMHYFPDAKTLQITQTGRDTKRRMHYFPDAKTLQITQTGSVKNPNMVEMVPPKGS